MTARKNNSQKSAGGRGPGRPFKKGQSGNPKGRPPKGESWKDLIREIGAMQGTQVADWLAVYATQFRKLGDVKLKAAVVARAYLASLNEPNGSLLKALMSYDDGLPPQAVEIGGNDSPIHVLVEYVEGEEAEAALDTEGGEV
jgi:hypothetical protein